MQIGEVKVNDIKLVKGDESAASDTDLFTVLGRLDVDEPLPEGWRVLTGNRHSSLVAATFYRFELEKIGLLPLPRL